MAPPVLASRQVPEVDGGELPAPAPLWPPDEVATERRGCFVGEGHRWFRVGLPPARSMAEVRSRTPVVSRADFVRSRACQQASPDIA